MKLHYLLLIVVTLFTSCSGPTAPSDPIPTHETFTINSSQVGEVRTINVWVPDSYNANQDSLAVMYMADGGIKEDFPHIANTLAKLVKEEKIEPLILVGIENTERRRDLTGFTEVEKDKEIAPVVGGADKFSAFIAKELFPEIDKRYRTTSERSIIGESASGLFVMETFFLAPTMFTNYIAFDPSLWWNNHYLVGTAKDHLSKFPEDGKRIWFAGSGAEDISTFTKQLADILEKEKSSNIEWHYADEPKESHATIFRATKEKAILWTLNPVR